MNYIVFIDESGSFNKNSDKSVVGAGIMSISYRDLATNFKQMQQTVNEESVYKFDVSNDIHLAPLLHSNANSGTPEQRERFSKISIKERKLFANYCLDTVLLSFDKFVFSQNKGFEFEDSNPQDRYFHNLVPTISTALSYIASAGEYDNIFVYIAPRSKKCLPSSTNFNTYHEGLIKYLKEIFKNPKLSIGFDKNNRKKLGLDAADIICFYRDDMKIRSRAILTKPNASIISEKKIAESNILNELLERKEYVAAYRWVSSQVDREQVLIRISELDELERVDVLRSLLNIAYAMIQDRTSHQNTLKSAILLLKSIIGLSKNSEVSSLNEVFLMALDSLLSCLNHSGISKEQKNILSIYNEKINSVATIPYFTRKEKILKMRNKAYNQEFNTYCFQNIIDEFESEVKLRLTQIPNGEVDTLMGEMLGTLGQAYAFNSYANPDDVEISEGYLLESLEYIPSNHYFYGMSINYLATLRWFSEDYEDAMSLFCQHNESFTGKTAVQLIDEIVNTESFKLNDIFNLSVLLRIAISSDIICEQEITDIEAYLWKCEPSNHPYELIYKWLGIFHLYAENYEKAVSAFDKSIKLTVDSGFTIKTIALSVKGLRILALKDQTKRELSIDRIRYDLIKLTEVESFGTYINAIGGWDRMNEDLDNEDISAIIKWLPFAYA